MVHGCTVLVTIAIDSHNGWPHVLVPQVVVIQLLDQKAEASNLPLAVNSRVSFAPGFDQAHSYYK